MNHLKAGDFATYSLLYLTCFVNIPSRFTKAYNMPPTHSPIFGFLTLFLLQLFSG